MSLTARILEAAGIATVVIGSALDIVTHCRVPRYVHNDLPLGNPLGPPGDRQTQLASVVAALELLESSTEPAIKVTSAHWPGEPDWKRHFNRVEEENRDALRQKGEVLRAERAANKAKGLKR